jgi:hypothetical protein
MKATRKPEEPKGPAKDHTRELDKALDEAIEESFPASDPPAVGHSDHVGAPPSHKGTRSRTSRVKE